MCIGVWIHICIVNYRSHNDWDWDLFESRWRQFLISQLGLTQAEGGPALISSVESARSVCGSLNSGVFFLPILFLFHVLQAGLELPT